MTANWLTVVARLTPAGQGAIATVGVQGPAAVAAVGRLFRPHGSTAWGHVPIGRVWVGIWPSLSRGAELPSPAVGEELVVCRTAPERVEIHCHGGRAAVSAIVQSLCDLGCCEVDWLDIPEPPGETSLQRSARTALAAAHTGRVAAVLLDQYQGALQRALAQIAEWLERGAAAAASESLDRLLQHRQLGQHLVSGWQVTLAGPPNVGKSSLINALMGFPRAVVVDQPGTTRDVVTARTALDGWPVELADTAGLRATLEPLEAAGIQRAQARLQGSDVMVLVFDATCRVDDSAQRLLRQYPQALVVVNKCDLVPQPERISDDALLTSARTGAGVQDLICAWRTDWCRNRRDRAMRCLSRRSTSRCCRLLSDAIGRGDLCTAGQQICSLLRG